MLYRLCCSGRTLYAPTRRSTRPLARALARFSPAGPAGRAGSLAPPRRLGRQTGKPGLVRGDRRLVFPHRLRRHLCGGLRAARPADRRAAALAPPGRTRGPVGAELPPTDLPRIAGPGAGADPGFPRMDQGRFEPDGGAICPPQGDAGPGQSLPGRAWLAEVAQMRGEFAGFERSRKDTGQVDFLEFGAASSRSAVPWPANARNRPVRWWLPPPP